MVACERRRDINVFVTEATGSLEKFERGMSIVAAPVAGSSVEATPVSAKGANLVPGVSFTIAQQGGQKARDFPDSELVSQVVSGKLKFFNIENDIEDKDRAVRIRRMAVERMVGRRGMNKLPFENYDYNAVFGQCCENVIGYVPLPVGIAGFRTIPNMFLSIVRAFVD